MTAELTKPARRTVARVETKRRLGPDAQVDDKAMIIGPGTRCAVVSARRGTDGWSRVMSG